MKLATHASAVFVHNVEVRTVLVALRQVIHIGRRYSVRPLTTTFLGIKGIVPRAIKKDADLQYGTWASSGDRGNITRKVRLGCSLFRLLSNCTVSHLVGFPRKAACRLGQS